MVKCDFRANLKFLCTTQKFSPATIKVFARLFQKAAWSRTRSPRRAPQSAKSFYGVFFLIAFSFAAAMAKEKADREPSSAGSEAARGE